MKKIICSFLTITVLSIVAVISVSAQSHGTRVEANIPFDFTISGKTFKAGSYDLSLVRSNTGIYSVALRDAEGKSILRTMALRSGSTAEKGSEMVFAVVNGERYLETIKTPDMAYAFSTSYRNKQVAKIERVSVPTSGAPQF